MPSFFVYYACSLEVFEQYKFYLFILKLSFHLCRLPEQCDREVVLTQDKINFGILSPTKLSVLCTKFSFNESHLFFSVNHLLCCL